MCEYCDDLVIAIKDPLHKSNKKYDEALGILEKAFGYEPASGASEISPYRSVRELMDWSKGNVEAGILDLHNEIAEKWLRLSKAQGTFKLSGQIYINPKSGKPLTKKEWKIIRKDLERSFHYIFRHQDAQLIKTAMALGKVIATAPTGKAISATLGGMKPTDGIMIVDHDPAYRSAIQFAVDTAGENIQDMKQRHIKKIHDVVVNAQVNRDGPRQLETDLFQQFGNLNRDWKMISETEIATNVNNGQLIAELSKPRTEDYVFMQGLSAVTACPWCAGEINGRVVVLLDNPPPGGGDLITVGGEEYPVIWPGKSNVGRPRRDWWIAAGTQHPHCQCDWVRYVPGFEKQRNALMDAIAKESKQIKKQLLARMEPEMREKPVPWKT